MADTAGMELLHADKAVILPRHVVARQSRVSFAIMPIVLAAVAAGLAAAVVVGGGPALLWLAVGFIGLILLLTLRACTSAFGGSNWAVCLEDDRVLVKFRSYQNHHFDPQTPAIAAIPFREIASWRRRTEHMSRPMGDGTQTWKQESLEILLRDANTGLLAAAIDEERRRMGPRRWGVSTRSNHVPVHLPLPRVVSVTWRGQQDRLMPDIDAFMKRLPPSAGIEPPVTVDRRHDTLKDVDLDTLVIELCEKGDVLAATSILSERYGYTVTESRRFIDDLRPSSRYTEDHGDDAHENPDADHDHHHGHHHGGPGDDDGCRRVA